MTTITYKGRKKIFELTMDGHAEAIRSGEHDLVCASESILAYQLGQIVQDMFNEGKLTGKPKIVLNEGKVRIKCVPHREYRAETAYAFHYALIGFQLLAKNYPDNVCVKCKTEDERN